MSNALLMVGPPGAGKSTLARELRDHYRGFCAIISPVKVEFLHPHLVGQNDRIFAQLYEELDQLLAVGRTVILDATNLSPDYRRRPINIARRRAAHISAVWLDTPINLCLERAFNRTQDSRQVGLTEEAIVRMAETVHRYPPSPDEGFDRVFRVRPDEPLPFDQL